MAKEDFYAKSILHNAPPKINHPRERGVSQNFGKSRCHQEFGHAGSTRR